MSRDLSMTPDKQKALEEEHGMKSNIVAKWCIPIYGRTYYIEFDHGTTSGRRRIWINGKEIIRRDWMFKLVGEDSFPIDQTQCVIRVDPVPGFKYKYSLYIDGKPYKQYIEDQIRSYKAWSTTVDRVEYRIVLELDSLNIFLNDKLRPETGEFVDGGTDTNFEEDNVCFQLCARSSGNKRQGIQHTLKVNGEIIPEVFLTDFYDNWQEDM